MFNGILSSLLANLALIEIYRIVSSKVMDNGESGQNPIGERKVIEISKSADTEKPSGKCC